MRTQRSVSKERARVCVCVREIRETLQGVELPSRDQGPREITRKTMKNIFLKNYDIHRFGSRKKKNRRHTIKKAHGIMAER
jgi:hypothetical protein